MRNWILDLFCVEFVPHAFLFSGTQCYCSYSTRNRDCHVGSSSNSNRFREASEHPEVALVRDSFSEESLVAAYEAATELMTERGLLR